MWDVDVMNEAGCWIGWCGWGGWIGWGGKFFGGVKRPKTKNLTLCMTMPQAAGKNNWPK